MSKLPPLTCKQVKSALVAMGFELRKGNGSSHEKWVKTGDGTRWIVTVDCPKAPFSNDLIKSMAKQAGRPTKEFHRYCATF